MDRILEIFYEEFIPEVSRGDVECFFRYNILFNTLIAGKLIEAEKFENVIAPTLKISNKALFDDLLVKYVKKCLEFYEFEEEIKDDEYLKIKKILTFLFANATLDDFENPINLLKTRIAFLEDEMLKTIDETFNSETLSSEIHVWVEKAKLANETPYKVKFSLTGIDGGYSLPSIYVGINGSKAAIYAIQKDKELVSNNSKKVKRSLYKLDSGLDVKNETFENYDVGNLKDITPSFLLAINILVGILKEKGINEIEVSSMLPLRWNAKEIANQYKAKRYGKSESEIEQMLEDHEVLQSNLTEKLIRTFLRLAHHHTGINIASYPGEVSSNLSLRIDENDECNNLILEETFKINGGRHV